MLSDVLHAKKGRGKAAKVVNFLAKWLNLCLSTVNHNFNFVSICVVWNSRSLIFPCNKQKREIVWSMNVWKLQSNLIWDARSQAKFCSLVPFFHFGFPLFVARSHTYVHLYAASISNRHSLFIPCQTSRYGWSLLA